ncbi:MAG TPA: hypothetical protein DCS93_30725 [Microscillaceae bacterium]|nr:hypothetical protein [Microscillaceae bacterium]
MISDKLAHLTEGEIEDLIQRYYNKEKVSDLINEFNISLNPSQLIKHFPPEISDIECRYCDIKLIKPRKSRDSYSWNKTEASCPKCGHRENLFCPCDNCYEIKKQKKEKELQEKQHLLSQLFAIDEEGKIELTALTFTERIYLGALLREGVSEDYNYIRPLREFLNPFAPMANFQAEIIGHLLGNRVILIHPNTDAEFIEITDPKQDSFGYYPDKVTWYLNVRSNDLNKVPLIESIINPSELNELEFEEALMLWKKIALHESIEYFRYSIHHTLGIEYKIGDKTISVLKDLINDYAVSQIYGIIYKSTNNALRLQAEKGISKKHAANTIIGYAQSFGERAKVNHWDLVKYNRIRECPESALSKFFFERIVKIGFRGFNERPTLELIVNNLS